MEKLKVFPYVCPNRERANRRLTIVRRTDGLYAIADEYYYFSTDEDGFVYAEGWARLPAQGVFESVDLAEQEIQSMIGSMI